MRRSRELRGTGLARPGARCSTAKRPPAPPATRPPRRAVAAEIEALRRWCAAHVHDPALATGSSSGSPRRSTPSTWCTSCGPSPAGRRLVIGPEAKPPPPRWLRASPIARAGVRERAERDPLLRALPRARQGQLQKGIRDKQGAGDDEPARHRAGRLPARREDLGDAHRCASAATPSARWRWSRSTTRCARAPATASATTA